MFLTFYYLLRQRGLSVTPGQWLTLLEGLEKGLHHSSLTGFYHLCRCVLVKCEAEYDLFDRIFLEFFQEAASQGIPEELMAWLDRPSEDLRQSIEDLKRLGAGSRSLEEILRMLEARLEEQTEEHNGGAYWVGTQGRSVFGNSGWNPETLRVGGVSNLRAAVAAAGERKFRDFRQDRVLDSRQFQMAFRILRQYSAQLEFPEREFDVDATVRETGRRGGILQVRYRPPRKNAVKLLLLMDSGGSMEHYTSLCSTLFHAAMECSFFREVHFYYFHNCIWSSLYTEPDIQAEHAVPLDWVLQNFNTDYKVIILGDAAVAPAELTEPHYDWETAQWSASGWEQFRRIKDHYSRLIWLNPEPLPQRDGYLTRTHIRLAKLFHMYDLTVDGLRAGLKYLSTL